MLRLDFFWDDGRQELYDPCQGLTACLAELILLK